MRYVYILLLSFSTIPVFAQHNTPRIEVFGGFSYLHIDTQGAGSELKAACDSISSILIGSTCPPGTYQLLNNFKGWDGDVQINASRFLGIKADFSGYYGTALSLSPDAQSVLGLPGRVKPKIYSYLAGPVLFTSRGRYRPFAHALFGANSVNTNLTTANIGNIPGLTSTDTAFAMAFGGGVDVKLTDHISLRVGQGDYLFTKHDFSGGVKGIATHQNNFRASAGMVFQFGGRTQSTQGIPERNTPTERAIGMPILSLGILAVPAADNTGAAIAEVQPNSVAAFAGLHRDDMINTVNGTQIKTPMELAAALSHVPPGASVKLGYMIHGMWQSETTVILGNH